jgi:hypothetical protein
MHMITVAIYSGRTYGGKKSLDEATAEDSSKDDES